MDNTTPTTEPTVDLNDLHQAVLDAAAKDDFAAAQAALQSFQTALRDGYAAHVEQMESGSIR